MCFRTGRFIADYRWGNLRGWDVTLEIKRYRESYIRKFPRIQTLHNSFGKILSK